MALGHWQIRRMPQLSLYSRTRIFTLMQQYESDSEVLAALRQENINVCRQTLWRFKRHFNKHGTIGVLPRSGRFSKQQTILDFIEECMTENDEMTAKKLKLLLRMKSIHVSETTILRARRNLGWSYRGAAYCQLIRDVNRQKRLEWARTHIDDGFKDVVWSDESTIQLQTHKRYCCRKNGDKPRNKPRPKHPVKVHVWGGISWEGRTKICVFQGIMTATLYVEILQKCLVPSLRSLYPSGQHRFMQDNDPKHTSKLAQEFFDNNNITWWRTPPESPDANPIENLWHELKEYIRREVKPKNLNQLVEGILEFWESVDVNKCRRYIGHLKKVLPEMIKVDGAATGY